MSTIPRAEAPRAGREASAALHRLAREAGYTREGIQGALGTEGDVLFRRFDRPVHVRRLRGDASAFATLVRLFLLEAPENPDAAERALGTPALDVLRELGLVVEHDGALRGTVRIVPHGDLLVASDLADTEGSHPDHVAGLHRPSTTLADLTVRRPVATALDVGTGCGIQAMLAAEHSERVVATDVNERALAFAELNLALNGIENVELRAGSFFEPVAGERFELVICNPPYVVSPENAYVFRDSGLGRDRVSEELVGELPGFLADGGFATIMVSWVAEGDDPSARPSAWLEGSGCDAWIVHTGLEDALKTAATWNLDEAPDEAAYAAAIERWMEYFEAEGIAALAYGALVLRRRPAGANWIRARELPQGARSDPAEHVLRLFAAQDLLRATADEALLALPLRLAEGAAVARRLRRTGDGWEEEAELALVRGLPFSAELDGFTTELVVRLDGSQPAGALRDELAARHDADRVRVRAAGAKLLREMLELGFLLPDTAP